MKGKNRIKIYKTSNKKESGIDTAGFKSKNTSDFNLRIHGTCLNVASLSNEEKIFIFVSSFK